MRYIDVFNGDADGICALVQLRLAQPQESDLVTGIKRDIQLLSQVNADETTIITTLDISFDKNTEQVKRLLGSGAQISYIDHHQANTLFEHNRLTTHIDLDANTCTSLIVDRLLGGRYQTWALTAAFGDNLSSVAMQMGGDAGLSGSELHTLQELGILLNYNGYGASTEDLFFHPAVLYKKLRHYQTPFEFLNNDVMTYQTLADGYQQDMALALQAPIIHETANTAVIELPEEKWARRISGVFGNELANRHPERAHAVIKAKDDGSFLVSVRAPLNNKQGADELVSQFPTGGGRKAAAGINALPATMLDDFFLAFDKQYGNSA